MLEIYIDVLAGDSIDGGGLGDEKGADKQEEDITVVEKFEWSVDGVDCWWFCAVWNAVFEQWS